MQGKEHLLRKNPVAIVGMAGVFAGAKNLHEYWKNIIEGVDSITDIPASRWEIEEYFDPDPTAEDKTYCKRGGFIPDLDFDPVEYGLPPNILEDTDVSQLLALLIARDALEHAGYGRETGKLDDTLRANTGVVLGVGGGQKLITPLTSRLQYPIWRKVLKSSGINDADADRIIEKMKLAYVGWKENSFPGMLGNVISGRICNRFDLGGLNCVVDAACAASLGAVKMAVSELVEGRADMMLTGGVDTDNSPFMYMCFSKTPAFSKSGNIRPLDAQSDGMMIGEGVGMMVLKRLKDAERDGDKIFAVIKGIGNSSDGRYKSIYAPRKSGQVLAMNRAYEESGYKPGTVGLIEAHGTGTTAGDITELNSVNEVFSEGHKGESHIAIGSVKSQIGHTKACAGAAGMIKIAMALDQKVLPGTINVDNPNPNFDLENSALYVNAETRPWIHHSDEPRRASVSAFGFGGINVHFALEEYTGKKGESKRYYSSAYPIFFENDDVNALKKEIQEFSGKMQGEISMDTIEQQIIESEKKTGLPLKYRAGFVFSDLEDCKKKTSLLQSEMEKYTSGIVDSPVGVFISDLDVKNNDQVVALFPGQGSQYVNMGSELHYSLKGFSQSLEQMDAIRSKSKKSALSSVIYPKPVFDNESKNLLNKELTNTENAQPAIGAISAGLFNDLKSRGFKSSFHAGHSFGELTALWASGVLDDEGYYQLAMARGDAMSAIGGGKDSGKMLAVKASEDKLAEDIKDHKGVVMANINAPEQVVLGGPSDDIDKVALELETKGYKVSALNVSAAFHTPFVEHGVKKFANQIEKTNFKKPSKKVYSNSSGKAYPQEVDKIKKILSEHILNPVKFKNEIEKIYEDGGRIFVEIGPKRILSNLVKDILSDKDIFTVSTQSSPSNPPYSQYLESLVKLRALGCAVSLEDKFRVEFPKIVETSKLAVKVGGNSYVSDKTKQAFQDALNDGHTITPLPEMVQSQPTNRLKEESERIVARARGVMDQSMRELLQLQEQIHGPSTGTGVPPQIQSTPPPAPQPTAQPTPQPVATASSINGEEVNQKLKEVISDKTGYPVEMLENSMDMEADLGIDSIKRVEIFGAMQEAYPELASINPQALGELRTLGEIGTFLLEQAGGSAQSTPPPAPQPTAQPTPQPVAATPSINGEEVNQKLKEVISDKTGYPVEMLENSMDMEADLGIDSIKRVEIFGAMQEAYPELASINPQALGELRTLGEIGTFLLEQAGGSAQSTPPPAPQPTAQPTPQPVAATPSINGEEVNQKLKEVISDKTGYPVEMLENSMDMEADLGIDSIKRVEIFGAMQEAYPELASINPQALGELRTLGEIGTFLLEQAGGSTTSTPPPAPQPTAQPTPQPVATAPSINGEEVNQKLKEVISDKTGYPVEMLENSMDMEADLGIDSIKRVEIFGAMQEAYPELASINPQALGELRTLGEIGTFLLEQAGGSGSPEIAQNGSTTPAAETTAAEGSKKKVASHQLELKTANLVNIPSPDKLEMEHTGKVIIADANTLLGNTIADQLQEMGYTVARIDVEGSSDSHVSMKTATKQDAQQLIQNIVSDTSLSGFIYIHPHVKSADESKELSFLQKAFLLSSQLGDKWSDASRPFYLGISQIDGFCGMNNTSGNAVIGGGISGLVKCLNREWAGVFCRSIDVDPQLNQDELATEILNEITDSNQQITEVAINKKGRFGWDEQQDIPESNNKYAWENEVFLVTGGARGVTADCIKALAERKKATYILLGRTQNNFEEPAEYHNVSDEKEIKRLLMEEMKSKGEKPAIETLERTYRKIIANREINTTLSTLKSLGSNSSYYALDVTDKKACEKLIPEIENEHGKITAFIHGAGQLSDKSIADKTEQDFTKVIHPKVLGLTNLLGTLDKKSLKGLVCFSSVAGFYGNIGQTDYAIANEILNKYLFSEKLSQKNALVKSMIWGAWDGGMVSAELKKMFENSGIVLIDRNEGANVFADLFTEERSEDVLQIVGGELPGAGGSLASDQGRTYTIHRTIDLKSNAFFNDHAINGTAVIPYAASTSWFAEAAKALYPSFHLNRCFNSKLYKGLTFDKNEELELTMILNVESVSDQEIILSGHIQSLTPKGLPLKHYACSVSLIKNKKAAPTVDTGSIAQSTVLQGEKLYTDGSLFHEDYYKGISDVFEMNEKAIKYKAYLPQVSRDKQGQFPLDPVNSAILDVQFQGFLAWEKQMNQAGCLPQGFESVEVFDNPKNGDNYIVLIDILDSSSFKLVGDITLCDTSGKVYMKTTNLEGTVSKDLVFDTSKKAISE